MSSQPVVHAPLVIHEPLSGGTFGGAKEKEKILRIKTLIFNKFIFNINDNPRTNSLPGLPYQGPIKTNFGIAFVRLVTVSSVLYL